MAKIKYSAFITQISGKIAGSEFLNNGSGNVVRNQSIPCDPKTIPQNRQRLKFGDVARSYNLLRYSQAMAWSDFALRFTKTDRFGDRYHPNRRSLFISLNSNRVEIYEPIIFDPPSLAYPQSIKSVSVEIIDSPEHQDMKIHILPSLKSATKLIIYATPPLKNGVFSPNPNKFRKIAVIDHTFPKNGSILHFYQAVFHMQKHFSRRIAFHFKPVSVLSGITAKESAYIYEPE